MDETTISRAVSEMEQSGSATRWFFAPPRANTLLLRLWHLEDMMEATGDEPTNVTALLRDTRVCIRGRND